MDDERWERGMPVLERQLAPNAPTPGSRSSPSIARTSAAPPAVVPPRSVPELRPTPLQRHYVLLSVIPLCCGALAITALELGASLRDPIVRIAVIVGAPILFVANADATLRIWRSAWAWMPVNRGRGLFRLAWVMAALALLAIIVLATTVVVSA